MVCFNKFASCTTRVDPTCHQWWLCPHCYKKKAKQQEAHSMTLRVQFQYILYIALHQWHMSSPSHKCVSLLFLVLLIESTQQQQQQQQSQECADMPYRAVISRVDSQNNCQVKLREGYVNRGFGLASRFSDSLFCRLGTASITPSEQLMSPQRKRHARHVHSESALQDKY